MFKHFLTPIINTFNKDHILQSVFSVPFPVLTVTDRQMVKGRQATHRQTDRQTDRQTGSEGKGNG